MEIERLKLRNFRNLKAQTVELAPKINVFVGANGQGKTNLLEAVYLAAYGRSFRTNKVEHLVQQGQPQAIITIEAKDHIVKNTLEIILKDGRKSVTMNAKKVASTQLPYRLPVVLFSPESLQAIKEGPEERRQLLDEMLILLDPENQVLIAEFERAYKQKNKALRDISEGITPMREGKLILESLLPTYLERAVNLTTARIRGINAIKEDLQDTFKAISNDQNVEISVDYVISGKSALSLDQKSTYEIMHQRQMELFVRELESGMNLVGPQKHEVMFLYNRNDSRFFCSQGQQRALVLSFKIAQVLNQSRAHKHAPVLLLDDVLSELDETKRDYLVKFLKNCEAQTLVTTTDLAFCEELRTENLAEFIVEQGQVLRNS